VYVVKVKHTNVPVNILPSTELYQVTGMSAIPDRGCFFPWYM